MRFLVIISSVLIASSLFAQTPDRRFVEWDRNKDGKLSREELPKNLQRNFNRVDADRNGFISLAEHQRVSSSGKNRQRSRATGIDGYQITTDIPYAATKNPRQMLDLALPEKRKSDRPLPVLAFIHGGGWRKGSKNGGLRRLAPYLEAGGYAGVSIGYRLSDEAVWPAQIDDCKAAIRWLKANAKKYDLDPTRIAVHGTSAGGHLVAMLGVTGDDQTRVACVVDFFGPTELLTMDDHPSKIVHNAPDSPESKLIGGAIQQNKEKTRQASPMTHVSSDDAPILIARGTEDALVAYPQSVDFHAMLKKSGVDSTLITVKGGGHGLGGSELQSFVTRFLAIHLLDRKDSIADRTIMNSR